MNRIDAGQTNPTSRPPDGRAVGLAGDGSREAGAGQAAGRQDAVDLSSRGRLVSIAARAVAGADDVRADRVAALKASIASGAYQVDARGIAERLLRGGSFE